MAAAKGHIRKNDQVVVIAGRDKGKIGRVLRVFPSEGRLLVEKVNIVKRHTKPSMKNRQGGIVEKEAPLHVSNVMLLDPKKSERTRISFKVVDGKKVRVSKKSQEIIEAK
jgi:large subunit ribosomal protein L24